MFGYVRPCRPELKIKEDQLFRGYYCGVCKTLGKRSGPLCRLLLQYDLAFLSLLRDGVNEDCTPQRLRCPVKGNRIRMQQGGSIEFAADAHLLLSAAKLRDEKKDNGRGRLAAMLLSAPEKKAAQRYPELCEALEAMMDQQETLEKNGCADPDEAAEPFARFLAQLFSYEMPLEAKPSLRFMGYNIGKWIYWLDALDDYEKDAKSGNYNVWLRAGYSRAAAAEWALPLLMQCISQAQLCCDLLEVKRTRPLIENILQEGMPRVMDAVAEGRKLNDGSI